MSKTPHSNTAEPQPLSVLLVEDEQDQREIVADILYNKGFKVTEADSVEAAIVELKKAKQSGQLPDVVFSDWKLGSLTGIGLLDYVKQQKLPLGFVVATAYGSIKHAVEAIEKGADDYLSKPFQSQELLLAINKANTANQLRKQNQVLSSQLSEQDSMVDIVGQAQCMQKVFERIKRVSNTNATVLITGESGTGKELAARALHKESSRHQSPFIAINCGAIPETLAEAELFGAEKGAFTGATSQKIGKIEAAHNGTLFLDEIGELPLLLQAKLLRFLQEGTICRLGSTEEIKLDVRIIAATHRDLPKRVAESEFREDLYYRLNVVPIEMPPLRQRAEDVPRLIEHFLQKYRQQYAIVDADISQAVKKQLYDHPWPGNVRELSNRIERFVLLGDESELMADNHSSSNLSPTDQAQFNLPNEGLNWESFEKDCLQQALARNNGNKTQAAKFLGMTYKAFLYRLEKFGI